MTYYIALIKIGKEVYHAIGWNCEILDCDKIFHSTKYNNCYVFYLYEKEHRLIQCENLWCRYKIKKIGYCEEIKDFEIKILKRF